MADPAHSKLKTILDHFPLAREEDGRGKGMPERRGLRMPFIQNMRYIANHQNLPQCIAA